MKARLLSGVFLGLFVLAAAGFAQAQTPDFVPDKVEESFDKAAKPGWHATLKGAGTVNFNHSSSVVGAEDGATWALGFLINGDLKYRHKDGHIWESFLKWQLGYNKTPITENFLKSVDDFDLGTAYLYEFKKVNWMGVFVSLRLKAALLPGYLEAAAAYKVSKVDVDGNAIGLTKQYLSGDRIDLSGSFSPVTLRESAGIFANPLKKDYLDFQARLGIGAWEIIGNDAFSIAAQDDAAGTMTLKEIENSTQLGAELELKAKGVYKKFVTYGLGAGFMYPFWHNATTDLDGMDILNMEFEIMLGLKLTEWASLDYQFKAQRYPFVVDDWQVTNGLLLTLTAGVAWDK